MKILTEQEAINKRLSLENGAGVTIPSAGKESPFYLIEQDRRDQLYVRKNGLEAEMIYVNIDRSLALNRIVGPGNSLEIYPAKAEVAENFLNRVGVKE